MAIIGIDIGGTKTAVIAANDQGQIRRKIQFPTETDKGLKFTLDRIFQAIAQLEEKESGLLDNPTFGISCGGPLDSAAGVILSPPNLPGWDEVPITRLVTERFGGSAYLMNDANACALAEWHFGAAKGCRNAVFLTFGTGMGAGLILNGSLYCGTNDLAGEVGHIRLAEDGPIGYGKTGSFEGFCSGGGIRRLAQQIITQAWEKGERVAFCPDRDQLNAIDAKSVAQAATAGDPHALAIIEISARYLGRGLALLVDILNPEIIVIGSIYARCEELFRPTAMKVLQDEALLGALEHCRIVPAALGEQIGDYGALATALYGIKNRL